MKNSISHRSVALLVAVTALAYVTPAFSQHATLPDSLIPLDSEQGRRLLLESHSQEDYWPLSEVFVSQERQSYCGVASSTMVLNSLPVTQPEAPAWRPYHMFTQENFFNAQARAVRTADAVLNGGMTLEQLGGLLTANGAHAEVHYASDGNIDEFRRDVSANLAQRGNFVILNYLRSAVGQGGTDPIERMLAGHFSPLAAYNEQSDRFLVMDVARYKYPPVWVETSALWSAVNTSDLDSGRSRGWVSVSPGVAGAHALPVKSASRSRLFTYFVAIVLAAFVVGALIGMLVGGRRARKRAAREEKKSA